MSKLHDCIDEELAAWLREQHVFFVATAPLSVQGHVNCSPKGGDSFRVLGPLEVAYQLMLRRHSEVIWLKFL